MPGVPRTRWTDRGWLASTIVAAVTALVFSRSLGHGFLEWDDVRLLVENAAYRGFGWSELRWMSSSTLLGHYAPVTWLSFALDHALWGLNPRGFHLTNIVLHAATAGLVSSLAASLIARATAWPVASCRLGGLAAALLWALHPLRVEAVSWITGRRDVLSAVFLCVALGAWFTSADRQGVSRWRWLVAALAAYALALGSKSIVMVAPLAMVGLDVYPLRRVPPDPRRWGARHLRAVWLEKVPFAVLAVLGAAVTAVAVPQGVGYTVLTVRDWLGKLALNLALPLWKTIAPVQLSPLYELPQSVDLPSFRYWGSGLLVLAVTVAVFRLARRCPGAPVAWVWYVVFLLPVSLITHAGPQITADRYSYLPTLALFLPVGVAVAAGHARWSLDGDRVLGLGVLTLATGLAALTWQQQAVWRDTRSLWEHAIRVAPDCAICQLNVGHIHLEAHRPEAALPYLEEALRLRPDRAVHHRSLGIALEMLGQRGQAIDRYRQGLALIPGALSLRLSLASALLEVGRLDEAIQTIDGAARAYAPAALVPYFTAAVQHRPAAPAPRLGLFRAWQALGDETRARAELEALRRVHPGLADLVAKDRGS